MNWGWKIALAYTGFVVMVLAMVVYTMNQDLFLVADDYYKQEIEYQQEIDKMENVAALSDKIRWKKEGTYIFLTFPKEFQNVKTAGNIHFFRPSDANKDKIIDLNVQGLQQKVFVGALDKGFWKLKINWQAGGKSYYQEEELLL
jgi:hypothetical protein